MALDVGGRLVPAEQISLFSSPIIVRIENSAPKLWDPAAYAPALPGVIVALIALFIAHWLTKRRERKKDVVSALEALRERASEACDSACEAWLSSAGRKRHIAIAETKSRLQSLGAAATLLERRARRLFIRSRLRKNWLQINLLLPISRLRDVSTVDPLEDPKRGPNGKQQQSIHAALAVVMVAIDRAIAALEVPPSGPR